MAKNSLIFLNLLNLAPQKSEDIVNYLGDSERIFTVSRNDLANIYSLSGKDIDKIIKNRDCHSLDKELECIARENVTVIDYNDENYPSLLNEISHKPLVLYAKGDVSILNKFLFAIVGTRIPTAYGISMAEEFSYKLASIGLIIVSGLARGIDTVAHKYAIKNGKTVAVLGSGLANIYPKENRDLAYKICDLGGAVISEFPVTTPPLKENFPKRNRIVSGLAKGVLIVEAAIKSGALITARYALEQNREVFAIPGQANSPLSQGTNCLIKQGAKLVESLSDILEELNITFEEKNQKEGFNLDKHEKTVLSLVSSEGVYLEDLMQRGDIEQAVINKTLLNLQLKGILKEAKPSFFIKVR